MPDRSWAVGLSQPDFEREFLRRRPGADVIPDVAIWSIGSEPVYSTIDAPSAESFVPDGPVKTEEEKKEEKANKIYPCRGCGKIFKYPVARAGHERKCKVLLGGKLNV